MRRFTIHYAIALAAVLMPLCAMGQDDGVSGLLSVDLESGNEEPRVMAVYGLSADDYLPAREAARKHLRPQLRSGSTRPSLDLPDAFYFVGGPIFIILFLRVLVIFLNGFEERRREELRTVAQEAWDAE